MIVRPYGDTLDDGAVQLSFTLPVPDGPQGPRGGAALRGEAGLQALRRSSTPTPSRRASPSTWPTARPRLGIDFDAVHVEEATGEKVYSMDEACEVIREKLGPQGRGGGRLHGLRRPHRRHRRHHEHEGLQPPLRAGALQRDRGLQPGRPGAQREADRLRREGERRRDPHLPDRHPEGCAHPEHDGVHRAARGQGPARALHRRARAARASATSSRWSWATTPASARAPTPTTSPPSSSTGSSSGRPPDELIPGFNVITGGSGDCKTDHLRGRGRRENPGGGRPSWWAASWPAARPHTIIQALKDEGHQEPDPDLQRHGGPRSQDAARSPAWAIWSRAKQFKKIIASHIGLNQETQRQMNAGETEVELVPQGTLAEQVRAGGRGPGRLPHAHGRGHRGGAGQAGHPRGRPALPAGAAPQGRRGASSRPRRRTRRATSSTTPRPGTSTR